MPISTYAYVGNNPIIRIDPDGRDWFEFKGRYFHIEDVKQDFKIAHYEFKHIGEAAIVFYGSNEESLSSDGYLDGEGANPSTVMVLGPEGQDDVEYYDGLTMSSNPDDYGVVAEGKYEGRRESMSRSVFKDRTTFRMYTPDGDSKIPDARGDNPATGESYLTGVFVHRTNYDGYAGAPVSKGCPVISGKQYDKFEKQLKNINKLSIIIKR